MDTDRTKHEANLKQIFGIDHFYDEQWEAIRRILRGERILMIQRTGFGKSLCYQYPATQFDGVTIIFSPLIALMRDQVKALNRRGIPARYINCEQTPEDNTQAMQDAIDGKVKVLYIAPERQENSEWIDKTRQMKLSMVVVDEAHTISVWGHDFRPAFRRIIDLVRLLPHNMPVLATTATATKRVQHDIEQQVGHNIKTIRGNLVRENFHLYVVKVQSEEEKMIWIAQHLNQINGTGLIYTGTRVNTEVYAKWLSFCGVNAVNYNAGLDAETRKEIEQGLMENKYKCVVSTNALGMGIDKADIRFVIHTQIPASPIHYYQEIGRAGRDGKPTTIILFYNDTLDGEGIPEDTKLQRAFINNARPSKEKYQRVISELKENPLSARELIMVTNLKQGEIQVIKSDLIDQKIIREVDYPGRKTKVLEYQYDAKLLDTTQFEILRHQKMQELAKMVDYIYTTKPRMQFLCDFLDNETTIPYSNCDNTNLQKLSVVVSEQWSSRLTDFRETYFPTLDIAETTSKTIKDTNTKWSVSFPNADMRPIVKCNDVEVNIKNLDPTEREVIDQLIATHGEKKSHAIDGVAASYYGVSNVGKALHRSKYEGGGDFPDFLLRLTLKAYYRTFRNARFDLVVYVPPTHSGDLVEHFAVKFAKSIKVPISHNLKKTRETREQKVFQNGFLKKNNVKDAFTFANPHMIDGKRIIVIDDIYDSGATMKEIARMLTDLGAVVIAPIAIARTVGGDI